MEFSERKNGRAKSSRSNEKILKYHLTSLGCPKNLVESEEMMAQLAISGMVLVHDPEEADLLVVNTCGFIGPAKEESVDVILELCHLRRNNPAQRLVVVGCLVQRYRQQLKDELPEVDAFIGVEDKETFLQLAWESLGQKPVHEFHAGVPFMPRLLTTPPIWPICASRMAVFINAVFALSRKFAERFARVRSKKSSRKPNRWPLGESKNWSSSRKIRHRMGWISIKNWPLPIFWSN